MLLYSAYYVQAQKRSESKSMGKVWSFCINVSPWLLLVLPVQLLLIELTTTPYLGLGQIILAFVLILYRTSHRNELLVRSGILLMYSVLLGITAETTKYDMHLTQHLTWAVLLIYVTALTYGVQSHDTAPLHSEKVSLDWRYVGALLGVFAVALTLRLQHMQLLPIFGGDEANAALYGIAVRDGVIKNLFGSGWFEFPTMWFVIPAFTHTLLPDGIWAVRIHSIIIGSLTCVALVWALKPIMALWFAAIAGVALAFFGVHIFFSQIGLNNICSPVADYLWRVGVDVYLAAQRVVASAAARFCIGGTDCRCRGCTTVGALLLSA